jgi:hypothetical protein
MWKEDLSAHSPEIGPLGIRGKSVDFDRTTKLTKSIATNLYYP